MLRVKKYDTKVKQIKTDVHEINNNVKLRYFINHPAASAD